MPKRLAAGNQKLGFVAIAPANPETLKLTEVMAGLELSEAVPKAGYSLGATASDKVNEPCLADDQNKSVPGNSNFAGAMDFLRYLDEDGKSVPAEDVPYNTFYAKGVHGWFVERVGPKAKRDWAVGDVVDVYEVISDEPMPPKDYNGFLKFGQTFHVQAAYRQVVLT